MKKVLVVLAALLFVSPVMANNVDLSCEPVGDHWFAINYSVTPTPAAPRVSAFALHIETNVSVIDQIRAFKTGESTAADPGYGIFPGSITFPGPVWGDPVAPGGSPGSLGVLPNAVITVELGALYDRNAIPDDGPLDAGTLLEVHIQHDGGSPRTPAYDAIVLSISEETAARGGIVMENLVPPTVTVCGAAIVAYPGTACAAPLCWGFPCHPCGDVDGSGGLTYAADVTPLSNNWNAATYDKCVDFNHDGLLTYAGDVTPISNAWNPPGVCGLPGCPF